MTLTVKDLEVGKTYRILSGENDGLVQLVDNLFTVSKIEHESVYTQDGTFCSQLAGDRHWCLYGYQFPSKDATFELVSQ